MLEVIAEHGLVLATGHLGRAEVFPIVKAAREAGVEHVVVTHPDFPAQDFSVDEQLELADMGAWIERCFTTPHRQVLVGAVAGGHARGRRGAHAAVERPRAGQEPARRGRPG